MPYDDEEEVFVRLTRRQKEFLEALIDIYEQTQEPVSYKDVGDAMNVSKWTAYDIIQELNRKGFLKLEYRLNPGPGRSEIRFVPKETAVERIKVVEPEGTFHFIRVWFSSQLKKYEDFSLPHAVSFIASKVSKESSSLLVMLYTVSLFVLFSKIYNIDGVIDLKKILSLNIYPAATLSFLAELMFSLIDQEENVLKFKVSQSTLDKFNTLKHKFRENIQLIPPNSQRKVLDYLETIL
jgi:predicted transcriptional regulator